MQASACHRGRITWAEGSHKFNRRQKPQGDSGQQITQEHSLQDGCERVTEFWAVFTEVLSPGQRDSRHQVLFRILI